LIHALGERVGILKEAKKALIRIGSAAAAPLAKGDRKHGC